MASKSSTAIAIREARERRRLELIGIRASRKIVLRLHVDIVKGFAQGQRNFSEQIAQATGDLEPDLQDGMTAAQLEGMVRSVINVTPALRDNAARRLGPYDAAVDVAQRRLLMTQEDIDAIKASYGIRAAAVTASFGASVDEAVSRAILESVREGDTVQAGQARIRKALQGATGNPASPYLTEQIFRTNMNVAYSAGRWDIAQDPDVQEILWGFEYVAILDDRVRATHEQLDGMLLPKNDPRWNDLWPPNGFNCFLPGTQVSGALRWCSRAEYEGEAIEILVDTGASLHVTVNHPIATDRGWVPAGELRERDCVFSSQRDIKLIKSISPPDATRGAINNQGTPARVEDLFDALSRGEGLLSREPATFEFHNEAAFFKGKVDIVWANIELLNEWNSSVFKGLGKRLFSVAYSSLRQINTFCPIAQLSPAAVAPTGGGPLRTTSLFDAAEDLLGANPAKFIRIGYAADSNAVSNEKTHQRRSAYSAFIRQALRCSSLGISLDQVVGIRRYPYCGHVYDLQSSTGNLLANGMLASNCRCTTVEIFESPPAGDAGVPEPEIDPDTGEPIPVAADIGFAFNPGQVFGGPVSPDVEKII